MPTGKDLVALLARHTGGPYGYGSKWPLNNPNPHGPVDCSGYVAWGCYQLGRPLNGGSWEQLAKCRTAHTIITVADAIRTPGALLFVGPNGETHIAVSRGDGTTVEARGKAYGVGSWTAIGRPWSTAALVPNISYGTSTPPAAPVPDPQTVTVSRGTLKGRPVAIQIVPIKTDAVGDGDHEAPPGFLCVMPAGAHDKYDPNTKDPDSIVVPIGARQHGDGWYLVVAGGPRDTWVGAPVLVSD